jgi:hypothetical protein
VTRAFFFAAAMGAAICASAGNPPTPLAEQHPGYGVVQSITPVRAEPAGESASAGSTAPGEARAKTTYLVRVKLDDGSIQIRQLKKPSVAVGRRVLITNAGEVLPE